MPRLKNEQRLEIDNAVYLRSQQIKSLKEKQRKEKIQELIDLLKKRKHELSLTPKEIKLRCIRDIRAKYQLVKEFWRANQHRRKKELGPQIKDVIKRVLELMPQEAVNKINRRTKVNVVQTLFDRLAILPSSEFEELNSLFGGEKELNFGWRYNGLSFVKDGELKQVLGGVGHETTHLAYGLASKKFHKVSTEALSFAIEKLILVDIFPRLRVRFVFEAKDGLVPQTNKNYQEGARRGNLIFLRALEIKKLFGRQRAILFMRELGRRNRLSPKDIQYVYNKFNY